jgi:hypothetical protein
MPLIKWPIWDIDVHYQCWIKHKRIMWTDRNWKPILIDKPTRQTM